MPVEDKVGATPQYGPPMSPTIFAQKWKAKFQNMLAHSYFDADNSNPTWMGDLCEEGYEYLRNYYSQAAELSLKITHFPTPSTPEEVAKFRGTSPDKIGPAVHKADQMNPFLTAGSFMCVVGSLIWRLEQMKHGDRMSGTAWQQLPLKNRQSINDLLTKVEDAKMAGWWDLPPPEQDRLRDKFRQIEAQGTWRC